jgi:hypothetical protein
MKKQAMLDILNQVVNDARTSIPTEVNPEVLQQPKLDKVLKEDD